MLNRWNRDPLPPARPGKTWLWVAAACLLLTRPGYGESTTTARKPGTHPSSSRYYQGADGPKARLRNGKEYRLGRLSEAEKRRIMEKAKRARERARTPKAHVQSTSATPAYVDNRRFHGPIRDQAQRGTCASFAVAAGLEGIYRRQDLNRYRYLDLSEQYINHVQKMVERFPTNKPGQMEDEMGCWAGSQIHYISAVVYRYGAPEEAVMAYNPTGDFQKTGSQYQDNDENPRSDAPQLAADNFNLDRNNLPDTALDKATYRPQKLYWLTDTQMSDTNTVEQWVANGYDIVFGLNLVDEDRTDDGAWIPKDDAQPVGGHAMLIVGYNRDRRYFIVRNQWGPDPDAIDAGDPDGYARISYDYLEQYSGDGAVLAQPADPTTTTTERDWLARWNWADTGHLDLYRLPETYSRRDPRDHDYRVGTWFDANGKIYRVNGYFKDGDLIVYINYDKPGFPPDELSGDWYRLRLNADLQGFKAIDSGTEGQPVSGTNPAKPNQDTGVCGSRGQACH